MLTSQDIQQIQQLITQSKTRDNFGVPQTQNHTHTGLDSLKVSAFSIAIPNNTGYVFGGNTLRSQTYQVLFFGSINGDGTASVLPQGWSSVLADSGDGLFQVTHNLGTTKYSVVATAIESGNFVWIANITAKGATTFEVRTTRYDSTESSQPFDFMMAVQY